MRRGYESVQAEGSVLDALSLRVDPFEHIGTTAPDAHSWVTAFSNTLWWRVVGSIPNHHQLQQDQYGDHFEDCLLWGDGIVSLLGDPHQWCGRLDLQFISAALMNESRIARRALGDLATPRPDDDDETVRIGSWQIRPGEASYNGEDYFRIAGVLRRMLLCFVQSRGRTVSLTRLQREVWPDDSQKADEPIRAEVSKLRKYLMTRLAAVLASRDIRDPIPRAGDSSYKFRLL